MNRTENISQELALLLNKNALIYFPNSLRKEMSQQHVLDSIKRRSVSLTFLKDILNLKNDELNKIFDETIETIIEEINKGELGYSFKMKDKFEVIKNIFLINNIRKINSWNNELIKKYCENSFPFDRKYFNLCMFFIENNLLNKRENIYDLFKCDKLMKYSLEDLNFAIKIYEKEQDNKTLDKIMYLIKEYKVADSTYNKVTIPKLKKILANNNLTDKIKEIDAIINDNKDPFEIIDNCLYITINNEKIKNIRKKLDEKINYFFDFGHEINILLKKVKDETKISLLDDFRDKEDSLLKLDVDELKKGNVTTGIKVKSELCSNLVFSCKNEEDKKIKKEMVEKIIKELLNKEYNNDVWFETIKKIVLYTNISNKISENNDESKIIKKKNKI